MKQGTLNYYAKGILRETVASQYTESEIDIIEGYISEVYTEQTLNNKSRTKARRRQSQI